MVTIPIVNEEVKNGCIYQIQQAWSRAWIVEFHGFNSHAVIFIHLPSEIRTEDWKWYVDPDDGDWGSLKNVSQLNHNAAERLKIFQCIQLLQMLYVLDPDGLMNWRNTNLVHFETLQNSKCKNTLCSIKSYKYKKSKAFTLQLCLICKFSATDYDVFWVCTWTATKEQEHPPLCPSVHIPVGEAHRNSTRHRNKCCYLHESQQNKVILRLTTHFSVAGSNEATKCTMHMERSPMG